MMRSLGEAVFRYDWCPYRKGEIWAQKETYVEGRLREETGKHGRRRVGVTSLQAGPLQTASKPPEARRGPWTAFGKKQPCLLLSDTREVRRTLLPLPSETNTVVNLRIEWFYIMNTIFSDNL